MRVIVLGGSGFIGNSLLKLPEMQKHEAIVVTRNPQHIKKYADRGIEAVVWDYATNSLLKPYLQGHYAIINLAGENIGGLWTGAHKKRIMQSRRKIALKLSELVNSSVVKPEVIIQASASGYYGSQGEKEIDEQHKKGKGFLSDVAAITEESLQIKSDKTRVIYIRTGIVLGKGGGFVKRLFIPFKLYLGGHFGRGKQWLPWIHRYDEVKAISFLLDKPGSHGVYNLCSPNPVRMRHFCKIFGKILYRPSWLHIPAFLLKLVLGDFARELLLTSVKMKPERLLKEGFHFEFTDPEVALKDLFSENG
ncbi:MAG: TIGR01777 family oxidoreductase [Bacteroidales bacterium]|nr:TIGR01777 family oxidoreductase [Bacteroidales bacterium]